MNLNIFKLELFRYLKTVTSTNDNVNSNENISKIELKDDTKVENKIDFSEINEELSDIKQMLSIDELKEKIQQGEFNIEELFEKIKEIFPESGFALEFDKNQDEILNEDEIEKFVNSIIELLDNFQNGSTAEEFFDSLKSLADELGINIDEAEDIPNGILDETEESVVEEVENKKDAPKYNNNSLGGGNYDYSTGGTNTSQNNNKEYSLMTTDELKAQKTEQEGIIKTAQDEIASLTTKKEEDLAELKQDFDEEIKENASISDELKEKYSENEQNILDKTKEIDDTKSEITAKDNELRTLNSDLAACISNISALENALASFDEQGFEEPVLTQKKSKLESDLSAARSKKTELEGQIAEKEGEKEQLEKDLATKEEELNALKQTKAELEAEMITVGGEVVKELIEKYNSSVKQVEEKYSKDIEAKQIKIDDAKTEIGKIEAAINTKNERITKTEYSKQAELFGGNIKIEEVKNSDGLPYLVIGPADVGADEELPTMVYLHGSGEVGKDLSILKTVGPGKIMAEWGMENFRGYVLCPLLDSGDWASPKGEAKLRKTMESFEKTHKIKKDSCVIAGHSLGGMGALYMANTMSDVFSKAVSLSPFNVNNTKSGMKIPTRIYYGSHDSANSITFSREMLNRGVKQQDLFVVNSGHGGVPKSAFTIDSDGNGRSDLIEWLFN